jgi:N6-adenosine-specific RNA methylase IME4
MNVSSSSSVPIADIKVGIRCRKELGDIDGLATSIKNLGLFHPIVVNEKNELIAGYRRIEACKQLGWTEVPVRLVNLEDIRKGEIEENTVRKDFVASEIAAIYNALAPTEKQEAATRKEQTQFVKGKKGVQGGSKLDSPKGRTTENIGQYVGKSHATVEKIVAIDKAAKENPEKFGKLMEKVDNGEISVNGASIQVNRANKHADTPKLPEGQFDVIYADPPWKYEFCLEADPQEHYGTMATKDVCSLEVPTAQNAILFLWATNPKLEDALTVVKAWGFKYTTNLVWTKQTKGPGYYSMAQHELLLICKRGDIPPPEAQNRPTSVIQADREKHSKKPDLFYEIIEKMYPNRKYLELFARNKRDNWVSWGNELGTN